MDVKRVILILIAHPRDNDTCEVTIGGETVELRISLGKCATCVHCDNSVFRDFTTDPLYPACEAPINVMESIHPGPDFGCIHYEPTKGEKHGKTGT